VTLSVENALISTQVLLSALLPTAPLVTAMPVKPNRARVSGVSYRYRVRVCTAQRHDHGGHARAAAGRLGASNDPFLKETGSARLTTRYARFERQ
jgi:hypothetical protein